MPKKRKFAGEIIVERREALGTPGTKIDEMIEGLRKGLPDVKREKKLKYYCRKLQLIWEGKLCLN